MINYRMKTPIVYYGGKTAILPHLLEMVPIHTCYTEAFMGGGTLFWAKQQVKSETINDRSDVVINFYRILKSSYGRLKKLIDQTTCSRSLTRYGNTLIRRHMRGEIVNRIELAWAFWYTTNFNYSRKLGAGMSFSNNKSVCTPDTVQSKKREFTELLVARLEHAYIENDDFLRVLQSRNVPYAFHYLDPPYFFGESGHADHGHYRKIFSIADYERLLTWCAECKGKFLLSNYNSTTLDRFIKVHGWKKKEITHRLSAPRKSGTAKVEILVSNYDTPCGTLKLF